jgi:hypothetical protein
MIGRSGPGREASYPLGDVPALRCVYLRVGAKTIQAKGLIDRWREDAVLALFTVDTGKRALAEDAQGWATRGRSISCTVIRIHVPLGDPCQAQCASPNSEIDVAQVFGVFALFWKEAWHAVDGPDSVYLLSSVVDWEVERRSEILLLHVLTAKETLLLDLQNHVSLLNQLFHLGLQHDNHGDGLFNSLVTFLELVEQGFVHLLGLTLLFF